MTIFDVLSLVGGLSLFLFGMNVMGTALEKSAGNSLKSLLGKLTSGKMAGFLTGLGVTAIIQSSSATTVMVVGFVNSGIMSLTQAINVIMGANVGTTVTAWILSLTGIESSNLFMQLLKPTSFTPILALIGVVMTMMCKSSRKKDVGMILLGFATLMFGMDAMSDAVSGLKDVPEFRNILLLFSNPILGVVTGAVLTGIIQSSSASVGILQALSSTGQITMGAAIPIIMGQNIGTCVTAMISSVGTNKSARRTAVVHLLFNIIGTTVWLSVFTLANALLDFAFVDGAANEWNIAVVHTVFNLLSTALLLPMTGLLEKIACRIIPDKADAGVMVELDERLFATPALAIDRCHAVTEDMARVAHRALKNAMVSISAPTSELAESIRNDEAKADHYEDIIGTYLVHMTRNPMSEADRMQSAKMLRLIGDFERISDHAVNVLEAGEELRDKEIQFSEAAQKELAVLLRATEEILDLAMSSFLSGDMKKATLVEPLEEVVDRLKDQLRNRHILRLQKGGCSIEAGFVWSDLITNLERVADHCSNIASCIIEMSHSRMDLHGYQDSVTASSREFVNRYHEYSEKYTLAE